MSLSFAVAGTGGAARSVSAAPSADRAPSAVTEVRIEKVELVLARVGLGRVHAGDACGEDDDDAACAPFRAGPVRVDLPLSGKAVTPFVSLSPTPGTYDRVAFRIHRPEGNDASTQQFFAANPDWPGSAAIRVSGTVAVGGKEFAFVTPLRLAAQIRQHLDPPLVIGEGADATGFSVTVEVDVDRWFTRADGTLINPLELTSDQRLLSRVEKNIRESFRALHKSGRKSDGDGKGKSGKGGDKDDRGKKGRDH